MELNLIPEKPDLSIQVNLSTTQGSPNRLRLFMTPKTKFLILVLLMSIIKLKSCIISLGQKRKLWKLFTSLQEFTPSQLQSNLIKGVENAQYAICRGTLTAGESCPSILKPHINVIYSELFLKKTMQVKETFHEISQFVKRKRPSHLIVSDSKTSVQVYETASTIHQMTNRLVDKNSPNSQKTKTLLKKMRLLKNFLSFISDYRLPQIADQYLQQNYLPEGANGLVFGRFQKGFTQDKVFCENPIIIGIDKVQIAEVIRNDLRWIQFKKFGAAFIIGIVSIFLLRQAYLHYKRVRENKQNNLISKYTLLKVKSRVCSSCKTVLSSVINEPCGHFNQCVKCSRESLACIQCKKRRKHILEVYVC